MTVLQTGIVVFDMTELLGALVDILFEAIHIVLEVCLNLLKLLCLCLEGQQGFGAVIFDLYNTAFQVLRTVQRLLGLLQLHERVVFRYVLTQTALHQVDQIRRLRTVGQIEVIRILVPFIEVR